MNRIFNSRILAALLVVALAIGLAPLSYAQSSPTRTTLSAAMTAPGSGTTNSSASTMTVASATGITASTGSLQQFCLVDFELMQVRAVSGTTITVARGRQGIGAAHISGATVICGYTATFNGATGTISTTVGSPAVGASVTGGTFVSVLPTGSCTRASNGILPVFYVPSQANLLGATVDCLGGKWMAGNLPDQPTNALVVTGPCSVPVGSVAYGSFGTSTTTSTTGEFTISVFVPNTIFATGITNLNGSAVDGASKKIFILRDEKGNLIANTATAGTTATGNDAFQAIAFTATRLLMGPATYFIGLQDDTADVNGVRTVAASTFKNVAASSITSVFGTVAAAVTVPTTFTADTGPVACIY